MIDPVDVTVGVEADRRRDAREEDVLGTSLGQDRNRLTLEVLDGTHALGTVELEAAHVHAAEKHDRRALIERDYQRCAEVHADIELAGTHRLRARQARGGKALAYVLNLAESLRTQQFLGNILRGE